jgi:beta-lactamase class A
MRHLQIGALLFCVLGVAPSNAPAQTPSPSPEPSATNAEAAAIALARGRIDAMLRTGHADPAWFSESFLAQIPVAKVDQIIGSIEDSVGAYQSLEFTPEAFVAHFAKGTYEVLIRLDEDNKINYLLFRPTVTGLDGALHALEPQSGTLSYVIIEAGRQVAALNASAPLAVGSAFKLAVLNALRDEVSRGRRHWADVVPLREGWKSLPSGVIRTWPSGTPITLATYATQMVSISDNTAADTLVHLVGPRALQPYAFGNDPFLTTREAFILKSSAGVALRAAYDAAATPQARAAILSRADALPLPQLSELMTAPDLAIEWHYSVQSLCSLMQRVADMPLMQVNPGAASSGDFRAVAYKGGSDLGVINMTTMVTTKRGTHICFSATANDPSHDVDDTAFESAYATALTYLAAR